MAESFLSEQAPIKSIVRRREWLLARIRQSDRNFARIENSMQELSAIMYLGRLKREAREEFLQTVTRQQTLAAKVNDSEKITELKISTQVFEPEIMTKSGTDISEEKLFEKSMRSIGKIVSEKT